MPFHLCDYKNMFSRFSVFLAIPLLFGCASVLESGVQDLTIATPGAEDAICYVYVDGFRYRFNTPDTVTIKKNHKDLVVDCLAPGNRRKSVTVKPEVSNLIFANLANGLVPGAAWDIASGAAFKFPGVLEIDFTGIPLIPEALPAHNNPDIRQPESYSLEEFLPGMPRLNSDQYNETTVLERRRRKGAAKEFESHYIGTSPAPFSKGHLPDVPQRTANPSNSGASQSSADAAPAPLYPGE